ncbi:hypothetical protein [Caulobacter endophyticus]|uniref:hypothetical protein n=1 Tax=Caulobacter endophyticus TaxID=2172652 RepID=UPI00240FF2CE|nr:hypothetical protein [Caulobacter endophyticus]MDG2530680.1 hypothetical protein [Caulobacter endophyticus]
MSKSIRSRFLAVAAAAATLAAALAPQAAQAFGTVRKLGQNAEHERITRRALEPAGFERLTLNQLAGTSLMVGAGTFGAVGAPDRPFRGLISVTEAHCDDGDWFDARDYDQSRAQADQALRACRALMYRNLDEALRRAGDLVRPDLSLGDVSVESGCKFDESDKDTAKCRVLEYFGLALHAAQDFYSHTNWVDAPRAAPTIKDPQGLNRDAPAEWLGPAQPDEVPAGLISGCYGFPEWASCGGRIKHDYLNKDTVHTGRGGYEKAMAVAAADTRAKWEQLSERVLARYGQARGGKILCAIKADDPRRTCG